MTTALLITVIGMGLVFAAIIVLWIGMAVLVRLTADPPTPDLPPEPLPPPASSTTEAAIVAVIAVALALQNSALPPTQPTLLWPSTASVSAWQAVMRSRQLTNRGPVR